MTKMLRGWSWGALGEGQQQPSEYVILLLKNPIFPYSPAIFYLIKKNTVAAEMPSVQDRAEFKYSKPPDTTDGSSAPTVKSSLFEGSFQCIFIC